MSDYDLLLMGTGFETKRIFITGGTGFLGRAVQTALTDRGVTDICAPSSADVDFRDPTAARTAIETNARGGENGCSAVIELYIIVFQFSVEII